MRNVDVKLLSSSGTTSFVEELDLRTDAVGDESEECSGGLAILEWGICDAEAGSDA